MLSADAFFKFSDGLLDTTIFVSKLSICCIKLFNCLIPKVRNSNKIYRIIDFELSSRKDIRNQRESYR